MTLDRVIEPKPWIVEDRTDKDNLRLIDIEISRDPDNPSGAIYPLTPLDIRVIDVLTGKLMEDVQSLSLGIALHDKVIEVVLRRLDMERLNKVTINNRAELLDYEFIEVAQLRDIFKT